MSLRALVRGRTTEGFRHALWLTRQEAARQRRHHRAARDARALYEGTPLRLNLGCGPNVKAGWVNIDQAAPGALPLDLREDLPFPDGSVDWIYSEHFFEHLEYPREVRHLLAEARRVLVPDGRLTIGVPRVENALRDYASGSDAWFALMREGIHPAWCNTRMHNINYLFRQEGEHQYAYDFETLATVLRESGFEGSHEREWDAATDDERRKGTMYVESRRPG